jgi:hypothetical protein
VKSKGCAIEIDATVLTVLAVADSLNLIDPIDALVGVIYVVSDNAAHSIAATVFFDAWTSARLHLM